jgi:hypothetical protein
LPIKRRFYTLTTYVEKALFEHEFWLKVLRDHSIFLEGALHHKEKEDIAKAVHFKEYFIKELEKLPSLSKDQLRQLSKQVAPQVKALKEFKLSIIKRQLQGKIKIHFGPTFINHMVNELEEYEKVLGYLKNGEGPPIFHELHHHLLWLSDAAGHAGAISGTVDLAEKDLRQKGLIFEKQFNEFYLKAVELANYLRANIRTFPALRKFNDDVDIEIRLFQIFLEELEEMEMKEEALGSFSAQMADHMYREESYYIQKVAEAEKVYRRE